MDYITKESVKYLNLYPDGFTDHWFCNSLQEAKEHRNPYCMGTIELITDKDGQLISTKVVD